MTERGKPVRHEVKSSVKDETLIEKRRDQMIRGAVKLFREKGFHRTTTREIAKEAGFSIGTLYEYIRTKEDVLYLVCDRIYDEVNSRLAPLAGQPGTIGGLKDAIHQYITLIDDMDDEFTVMYQESKSLPKTALKYVLEKELEMTALFEKILIGCAETGELRISGKEAKLAAHHIVVQGQMWAFRRWALHKLFTLQEFITMQTDELINGLVVRQREGEPS
ncbi:TetR/AcrR family transcriptional regulator [Edaphobacillus lindanitolerans]|uniref:Transcriptional regulator, TetR family n=1 Tax=Edaphobacillus lindanitolerans TaxID=550447 RepID=A0A1U7PJB8_9BACI|nr:TetR/AcrR family transcriptional regulator [Edaphobacillus lindanitolerans]SIT69792.1 transcriptional regulator, TetR family [Edaphobacillus lindanitolerans]